MDASEWIGIAALQLLVLGALGALGGWIAGRVGMVRILGGVVAGMLLGPAVLGQSPPDWHESLFGGGTPAQRELREYRAERESARRRLEATDASETALREFDQETERRLAELRSDAQEAGRPYRRASLAVAAAAVGIALLGAGALASVRGLLPAIGTAGPAGLLSLLTPAALAAFAGWAMLRTRWLTPDGADHTAWLGGMALGCGVAAVPPGRRLLAWVGPIREGEEAEALRRSVRAAAWASGGAALLVVAVLLVVRADPSEPAAFGGMPHRYLGLGALAALAMGAICGHLLRREDGPASARPPWWFLPAEGLLFAAVGARVPLLTEFDWLLVLVVLLLFGDGKSMGMMLGAKLFAHRDWLEGMRMGTVMAAGGVVPLAVALLLRVGGVIDGALFVALVLAAVLTAVLSRTMTRMIDQWMIEAEPPSESSDR
jgi:MFS family permease